MALKKTPAKAKKEEVQLPQEEIIDGHNQEDNTAAPQASPKRKGTVSKVASVKAKATAEATTDKNTASPVDVIDDTEKPLAKAGKRSQKALAEKAELEAKEARKAAAKASEEHDTPKETVKPARTKIERASKKMRAAFALIEKEKEYSAKEALELAVKTSTTKFDGTVELHINLNVDPRQADQNIRDNLMLPSGTGKAVRVAVLADGDQLAAAKTAGADLAGAEDLLQKFEKGELNFDLLIATPAMMPKLGKYARLLGPKGLMPNPKSGTVTTNIAKAIEEAKAGRVEYRVDSTGIVHLGIGKVSFGADKLFKNLETVFASIKSNKPASVKSTYVKTIHLSTTMGPSIKIAISEL